jgi:hypothetical protein
MAYQDIFNNLKEVVGLAPIKILANGAVVSIIVDTLGFESAEFNLALGIVTTGDLTITSIQESDAANMAGGTDIPATRLFNTPTLLDTTNDIDTLGFLTDKRYVTATITGANTSVMLASGIFILGDPQSASTR